MLSTLNTLSNESLVLHKDTLPKYLASMGAECLTLVGFEDQDLSKLYDALDICSKNKAVQTVEVFIESARQFVGSNHQANPGLCLVRVPKTKSAGEYKYTLLAIANASNNNSSTMIPVIDCVRSINELPKVIRENSPYYISMNSDVEDFVSMFSAYLFGSDNATEIGLEAEEEEDVQPLKIQSKPTAHVQSQRRKEKSSVV